MARFKLFHLLMASALLIARPVLAQADGDRYHGPHMWDGGWWMILGPLGMIVFVAVIVVVGILLVRWLGGTRLPAAPAPQPNSTAMDILKQRFARGEIDRQEFDDRRRVLE